jgi:hypothetical protein
MTSNEYGLLTTNEEKKKGKNKMEKLIEEF